VRSGDPLPDVHVADADGRRIGLRDLLRARETLVYFMKGDCFACGILNSATTDSAWKENRVVRLLTSPWSDHGTQYPDAFTLGRL
jgi:hypothetical protein